MRMMVCTPRPSSPTRRPRHAAELDLGRGQRAGAELVLEPLDLEAGVGALDQEARQPGRRLGQRQEHVARGVGAEPLVAGDGVGAVALRLGAGGVGAHVRAALLLGHGHAGDGALAGAVLGGAPGAAPTRLGQVGGLAQRGDDRVGHRDGAHHARVDLVPQEHQPGADRVGARPRVGPRQRVDAALDALAQQPVPRRVELDLVHAVAVAVVGPAARARCARSARSAPAPRASRPARRCRRSGRRPSRRPRAPAPPAAAVSASKTL